MQFLNAFRVKYHIAILAVVYLLVIAIWSTTPLTIKWSGEGVHFLFGIVLRMAIGCVIAISLVFIWYKRMAFDRQAIKVYFASSLAIFAGMMPVYWGSQFISSGVVSVVFGLSPIVTGYLAFRVLHEPSFKLSKIIGSVLSVIGLLVIFMQKMQLDEYYIWGLAAVLLAVLMHSISAVWIKSIKTDIPALMLVAGGLLFSMPFFIASYLLFAPPPPDIIPNRAIYSIIYLGIVGSVMGFVGYYFLLKHMKTSNVALITLITPVAALTIGNIVNHEVISTDIYVGSALILIGLLLHQVGDRWVKIKAKN